MNLRRAALYMMTLVIGLLCLEPVVNEQKEQSIDTKDEVVVEDSDPVVEQPPVIETPVEKPVEKPVSKPTSSVSRGGIDREAIKLDTENQGLKFTLSAEDREMLARLTKLEAGGESDASQRGVISVVLNRLYSGYWGDTLTSVIYAKNQFTPAYKIKDTTPSQRQYDNVDYVLEHGTTLPYYVLYFRADYHFNWKGYHPYVHLDRTYFGYMSKDKKN